VIRGEPGCAASSAGSSARVTTTFLVGTRPTSIQRSRTRQEPWIVSCHLGRLFTRNQAITAMVLAERLAVGYGDDDPFVLGWREELGL
jgi:hypothetical protein